MVVLDIVQYCILVLPDVRDWCRVTERLPISYRNVKSGRSVVLRCTHLSGLQEIRILLVVPAANWIHAVQFEKGFLQARVNLANLFHLSKKLALNAKRFSTIFIRHDEEH